MLEMEDEADLPALVENNGVGDEFDSDFSDEDEDMNEASDEEPAKCLFCAKVLKSVEEGLKHIEDDHHLSFSKLKDRFQMDQYSFIKLINCIRADNASVEAIQNAKEVFWKDEKYLKPKEYEPWLCYDFEVMDGEEQGVGREETLDLDVNNEEYTKSMVLELRKKVKQQEELLQQAREDIETMRRSFKRLLDKEANDSNKKLNSVGARSVEADADYFTSYAHVGIHHEMLSDVVRTTSYRDALLQNKEFVKGKDVLDVGCGTSILSMFASLAGAKNVVGIDNSDILYNAMDIVENNKINNIKLVKGRLEDTELPQEKFDIIISEWMGYFLLFEGMLDTVIYARDHYLKPDGILMPNRCTLNIVGYGSDQLYNKYVTFWNDVYGLKMSNMRKEVLREPLVESVEPSDILTGNAMIADLDLMKVNMNYSNFTYNFNLKCLKDGTLSSFVGYFDTYFDLPSPVMFGTSPNDLPTHWKQVVFFLNEPFPVKTNDIISGSLVCKRSTGNMRSLNLTIDIFGKKNTYFLD